MITGNTSADTDRWYYSGSQVIPSGAGGGTWETVVDGLSFSTEGDPYLINLREIHPTGAWGNQVDPTGDAPPNGGSLTLRPIENGTVVEVKSVYASSGDVVWVFDVPNGVTAVCGEPEE